MAGVSELDSFVRKFILLWRTGSNAKLSVEAKAGEAFVNLSVGLGQAVPGAHAAKRRGGAGARQRRAERRVAERKMSAEAQKFSSMDSSCTEEVHVTKNIIEDEISIPPIPQVDGTAEVEAKFEVTVDAHEVCCNDDVIEAIEENFYGHLEDKQIEKSNPLASLLIEEAGKDLLKVQNVYRLNVKDDEKVTEIIERWQKPYEFDDLAFKNAKHGKVGIKIKDVKRIL